MGLWVTAVGWPQTRMCGHAVLTEGNSVRADNSLRFSQLCISRQKLTSA
jgi:hypothetical protein